MALRNCKECGEEISKKADKCPKCGAPQGPKQYSLGKLFVLIVFGVFMYSLFSDNSGTGTTSSTASQTKSKEAVAAKKAPPPEPVWNSSTSRDEMTGKLSAYASSPYAYPSTKMSFPYSDVHAWLGVGCDGATEWAYIGFNKAPNLANDETKDGYNLIKTRFNWNNNTENVVLTQDWGAKFIHFQTDSSVISKIASSTTATLELQWHGQQPSHFTFSLKGSSKALSEMRAKCSKSK